ncbi:MAG: Rho termination factor N-terminal domain-containing protein [Candidatus Izemoplasmataceae bacterium]
MIEVVNDDLEEKTVVELRELAKEKGLTGYSKLKKAELIEALRK